VPAAQLTSEVVDESELVSVDEVSEPLSSDESWMLVAESAFEVEPLGVPLSRHSVPEHD
jgi:hypothetical protein